MASSCQQSRLAINAPELQPVCKSSNAHEVCVSMHTARAAHEALLSIKLDTARDWPP